MSNDMDDLIAFIEPENKPVSYPRIDKIPMVHPVYAIHEHDIKRWAYAFRKQRDLLDECETLIVAMRQEIQNLGGSLEGVTTADATLAKLRAATGESR